MTCLIHEKEAAMLEKTGKIAVTLSDKEADVNGFVQVRRQEADLNGSD